MLDPVVTFDNEQVTLRFDARVGALSPALREVGERYGAGFGGVHAEVTRRAVEGLQFAGLLPPGLAEATLAARIEDRKSAQAVAERGIVERVG